MTPLSIEEIFVLYDLLSARDNLESAAKTPKGIRDLRILNLIADARAIISVCILEIKSYDGSNIFGT